MASEISPKNYLYRLAPDYSVIDMAEKDYWTKNSIYKDEEDNWYKIYKISGGSDAIETDAYRGIFASDFELEFTLKRTGTNQINDEIGITKITDSYMGKNIYIVAVDECEKIRSTIVITAVREPSTEAADCYITGVFF